MESVEGRVDLVQLGPYSTLSPTFSTQSKGNERGRAELTATNFTTASRGEWKAVGRRVSGRHASLPTHPRLGDSPWWLGLSRLRGYIKLNHRVGMFRGVLSLLLVLTLATKALAMTTTSKTINLLHRTAPLKQSFFALRHGQSLASKCP